MGGFCRSSTGLGSLQGCLQLLTAVRGGRGIGQCRITLRLDWAQLCSGVIQLRLSGSQLPTQCVQAVPYCLQFGHRFCLLRHRPCTGGGLARWTPPLRLTAPRHGVELLGQGQGRTRRSCGPQSQHGLVLGQVRRFKRWRCTVQSLLEQLQVCLRQLHESRLRCRWGALATAVVRGRAGGDASCDEGA